MLRNESSISLLTTIDSLVCKATLRKDDTIEESWKSTWTTLLTCAANSTFQKTTLASPEFSTELGKLKAELEKRKNEAMLSDKDRAAAGPVIEVRPAQPGDDPVDSPEAERPTVLPAKTLEQTVNIP